MLQRILHPFWFTLCIIHYLLNYFRSEVKSLSRVPTLCDPMDCSMPGSSVHGIFQQGYWSRLPFPSPGDLPNPEIEPRSPALRADSLPDEPQGKLIH